MIETTIRTCNPYSLPATLFVTLFFLCVSIQAQPQQRLLAGLTIENLDEYVGGFERNAVNKTCRPVPESDEFEQLTELTKRLNSLAVKPTLRIVFQDETKPEKYECALRELKRYGYQIMGLFLDSFALTRYRIKQNPNDPDYDATEKPTPKTLPDNQRLHDYKKRVDNYLDAFYSEVDIWEIGNEVNGEWADENCNRKPPKNAKDDEDGKCQNDHPTPASFTATIEKINYAVLKVKERNQATGNSKEMALTLVYQPNCSEWDENKMFTWYGNAKSHLDLADINYLLVSYYEDKKCDKNGKNTICDKDFFKDEHEDFEKAFCRLAADGKKRKSQEARQIYWDAFFARLRDDTRLNSIKFGFGEVGCRDKKCSSKTGLLSRYYEIRVNQSWFVGGYFWWTAQPDILTNGDFLPKLQEVFRVLGRR